VVFSTSTTALLSLLAGLAAVAALRVLRTGGIGTILVLAGVLLFGGGFGFIVAFSPELLFDLVGKDATLTGRTDIWAIASRLAEARPTLGYGYDAFWTPGGPAAFIHQGVEWEMGSAHNSWLELKLALGMVGVAALVFHLVFGVIATGRRLWSGPEVYWAVPLLVSMAVISLTESIFLSGRSLTWILYVATVTKLVALPYTRERTA
jgi:exopolysaccharide production protein ExoQ